MIRHEIEEDQMIIKEVNGCEIYQITRNDFKPEKVGMIVMNTDKGKIYPFNTVDEAEIFASKFK